MYYTYILQSLKDSRTYVGYSSNIKTRFELHQMGRVQATKHRRPLKLLFYEIFETKQEAKKRELWWKSGVGRKKLAEYFIENNTI